MEGGMGGEERRRAAAGETDRWNNLEGEQVRADLEGFSAGPASSTPFLLHQYPAGPASPTPSLLQSTSGQPSVYKLRATAASLTSSSGNTVSGRPTHHSSLSASNSHHSNLSVSV
ncbi:hypothetical protein E2C01_065139 [Portunus trituberculatus]|uniref:Uncharacterized protein n=1 Tax=Portunus trituberculatus TaxID=210409 RepID=A0A5B7HNT2_PORTR|nr:hypothetical protein [Portunus trituberculatus]